MLTGAVLGALVVLLTLGVVYFRGQVEPLRRMVIQSSEDLTRSDAALKKAHDLNLELGEQVKKMKQPYVINLAEEQMTQLAGMITRHMTMLHEAPHA